MSELKAYNVVATADVNPDVVDNLGCTEWPAYDKEETDKVIARHKYKRCLDKAKQCEEKCRGLENAVIRCSTYPYMSTCPTDCDPRYTFFKRWHKRWLELAEKFKEAK